MFHHNADSKIVIGIEKAINFSDILGRNLTFQKNYQGRVARKRVKFNQGLGETFN